MDKDLTHKDKGNDKDLKYVLRESLRTRTRSRINITDRHNCGCENMHNALPLTNYHSVAAAALTCGARVRATCLRVRLKATRSAGN